MNVASLAGKGRPTGVEAGEPFVSSQSPKPVLEVRGLAKVFSGQGKHVVALENFDLTVNAGEFVAIVGPSGCGKSTFLHMVGGFEPSNGGTIALNGQQVAEPGPDRGMLFQEYALYPWLTVLGNVLWPLEILKL